MSVPTTAVLTGVFHSIVFSASRKLFGSAYFSFSCSIYEWNLSLEYAILPFYALLPVDYTYNFMFCWPCIPVQFLQITNLSRDSFFPIYLLQYSTCFEHFCAHHQENRLYYCDIWYMSLYVGDCLVCRFGWNIQICTLDGHVHRVTYTICHIKTIDSPDDEHRSARNMYRFGVNIYEKRIVRQVGYLQELYVCYPTQ